MEFYPLAEQKTLEYTQLYVNQCFNNILKSRLILKISHQKT